MGVITSNADPRTLLSLVLLVVGTLLSMHALTSRRWEVLGAALVAAGIAGWTLTNTPYEGAVLFIPFDGNGVTAADLLCLPGLAALAALCWRSVRR